MFYPHKSSLISFANYGWVFTSTESGNTGVRWDPNSVATDTPISDVNAPRSGIVTAAFGRLWGADLDGHIVKYSALLDGTDWTNNGAGSIDMWNVWPGNDQITAIGTFNGTLVVFGKRAIVFWTDGAGSPLGVDPTAMYVTDIIEGVGCISRHSIQHVDGDLWFLSEFGLQSLSRLVAERSNPINNLSKNIQDYLGKAVSEANLDNLRSVYSPRDKLYLLSLPSGGSTESGRCFVFDTRGKMEDGAVRSLGSWTLVPAALCSLRNGNLIMALNSSSGFGQYTGQLDAQSTYVFDYESGWLDLTGQEYLLFPKRYGGVFFSDNALVILFKWALDFSVTFRSKTKEFTTGGISGGEWNIAEWNLSEFGGGVNLQDGNVTGEGSGKYIKLGLTAEIDNTVLAVQQLSLFSKVGRYA
jgi:hypothetical protein